MGPALLRLAGPQAALLPEAQRRALPRCVRVGCVLGSGPGYFKLQYGPGAGPTDAAERSSSSSSGGGGAPGESCGSRSGLLVVSFGSAPGTPNWGGLLSKVYKAATSDAERYGRMTLVRRTHYRDSCTFVVPECTR